MTKGGSKALPRLSAIVRAGAGSRGAGQEAAASSGSHRDGMISITYCNIKIKVFILCVLPLGAAWKLLLVGKRIVLYGTACPMRQVLSFPAVCGAVRGPLRS